MIDTSDMDPELARYLNRNYWQQKSVELKSSATATQPSAPAIAADTKMSTAGVGMTNSTGQQQQNAGRDDEVPMVFVLCCTVFSDQGSHASWRVLDFFVKFPGPGKWIWSWKVTEILVEGPGKCLNYLLGYDTRGRHNGAAGA